MFRRLLIFAKLPEPGLVKTRLIPRLGAAGAALLYEAFLDDTVALCAGVERASVEVWSPGDDSAPDRREAVAAYFRRRHPGVRLRWQVGADLGGRLGGAFETTFSEGQDHVVILGSDHPTLPATYVSRAFDALAATHLVLGPSEDGGYYLIGLDRSVWPAARGLFADVPWSTPRVLPLTRERAKALRLRRVELPPWYDVDEPSDLERLGREAHATSHTARALARLAGDASRAGTQPRAENDPS